MVQMIPSSALEIAQFSAGSTQPIPIVAAAARKQDEG